MAADPARFLQLPICLAVVRIPSKISWIRTEIRISTEIEWFVASETSKPSINFTMDSSTSASRVSSKILTMPLSRTQSFEKFSDICLDLAQRCESYRLLRVTHLEKFHQNSSITFELSCWQTNRQRQKHNLFVEGNNKTITAPVQAVASTSL